MVLSFQNVFLWQDVKVVNQTPENVILELRGKEEEAGQTLLVLMLPYPPFFHLPSVLLENMKNQQTGTDKPPRIRNPNFAHIGIA